MPPIAILVALADPTRCRIIEILRDGPQPVHMVAGAFKISRPAISRHLRVLKQARLISEKKIGRENLYALHADKLLPVAEWLAAMQAVKATTKPASKPRAAQKLTPKPAVFTHPAVSLAALPQPQLPAAPSAPKPKRDAPISQMGFDF